MLSIGKLSVGQEAYYLDEVLDGREDYYLSAGEAPGQWAGSLAGRLGLAGEVEAGPLRAVLAGHDPTRTYKVRSSSASLPGYDLTLSAPKSVSLVWGLGSAGVAQRAVAAHERAVDEALGYLEASACHVRRGRGGAEQVSGAGFVAAKFRHRTSRAGDPDLHTHVLVANMSEGPDGRWTTLDGRSLYHHARTAGFIYQARLRHELHDDLGLVFGEVVNGCADVVGVPADLCRAMSTRRRQILDVMEEHGTHSARSAQTATLLTRTAKDSTATEPVLRERWAHQAREHDFDLDRLPRDTSIVQLVVDHGLLARSVTEANATFDRRDVLRAIASTAWNGATLDDLDRCADAFLRGRDVVPVREGRWTTHEILAVECSTVRVAVAGRNAGAGVADHGSLAGALARHEHLGDDQREAVWSLVRSGAAIDVVIGPAGSGKTTMLDAAREAWERSGHTVVGAALAAKAAQQLSEGARIESMTADRLLTQLRRGRVHLDDQTVLVVDEAAMLGTRRLAALAALTHEAGAKLVLVGDPRQLAEIDAGGLFASLAARVPTISLTENHRQRDVDERAIAAALRIRATGAAMETMERIGRITVAPTAAMLREVIVSDWFDHRTAGDDTLMIAARRATVSDLNERAQELLRAAGSLGPEVATFGDSTFAVGDTVLAHHNDYRLGLLNGATGIVLGAGRHHLAIELDDGRRLQIPNSYIEAGHLTLGYALTVHKAQGTTCDQLLVLGDDTFTIETAYTALTRGRDRNQLYLAQPDLGDDHHGHAVSIGLIDAFTDAINRSSAKVAALDESAVEFDLDL